MREYMLYVILKNVRRMRKHKLITESIYNKFKLLEDQIEPPKNGSEGFKNYLIWLKKSNRFLDQEYLRFDSAIESGNLERVEAYPINHRDVDMQRARKQIVP